ncbi:MAG: RluA family pseudouridine synthase [Deltaproteobacteria bacterium]|nr:RluA family pseudouridine synthase [Deltaproteobacteria bacterium]
MSDERGERQGATRRARATVPAEQAGARLDQALAALVPELSRRLARKVLAMGAVHVNGKPVRIASYAVRAGDTLAATWHPDVLVPETFPLDVVHEDVDVVVVVKPAGQLSQGSELGDTGSLVHALQRRFGPATRLMHRLDKGASGLVVAGRHPDATGALTPQFREHTIKRRYLAVTQGVPAEGPCEVPIVIAGREARAARPCEDGLPARSDVVVKRLDDVPGGARRALVEVTLFTGRTHQIRIHLAALGAPIVGDPAYGGPAAGRLCLHATTLGFVAPDGTTRRFERAPDPSFWEAAGLAPPD